MFNEPEVRARFDRCRIGQGARRPKNEIAFIISKIRREWPINPERQRVARPCFDPVATDAKGEDGLDVMPPVRSPPADMKREVELGGCRFGQHPSIGFAHGAAVAGPNPWSILALIRAMSLASAVTSAARHEKRASKRRPAV